MINKILTTIFCLSLFVCGTAEAKKKVEQAKDGPFTEINFSTIKVRTKIPSDWFIKVRLRRMSQAG